MPEIVVRVKFDEAKLAFAAVMLEAEIRADGGKVGHDTVGELLAMWGEEMCQYPRGLLDDYGLIGAECEVIRAS